MGRSSRSTSRYLRILFLTILLSATSSVFAANQKGRLGVGLSNQFIHGLPAISVKLQRTTTFALGVLLATKFGGDDNGVGAGIKAYRLFFEEPQLNFFGSFMGGYLRRSDLAGSQSGFQFDLTLGSEFNFTGLESLGFSFEVGFSMNKLGSDLVLETVGHHFVSSAVHFYL